MSDRKIDNKRPGGFGLGPMGGGIGNVEKAKNFKCTMSKLIQYLKPYSMAIITVIIFAIGSAAIDFGDIGNIAIWLIRLYIISTVFKNGDFTHILNLQEFKNVQGISYLSEAINVSLKRIKSLNEKIKDYKI